MATGRSAIGTAKAISMAVSMALLLAAGRLPAQAVPETGLDQAGAETDALEPAVDTSAAESETADTEAEDADEDADEDAAEEVTRVESGGQVMDRMELGRTEITGNQELPKVLYIVPWQKSQHGDLSGRPVNTLIDEVLAPVDREEFIRTVDYYDELYGEADE